MANPHLIKVPRQSDRAIIELFRSIAKENSVPQVSLNIGAAGSLGVSSDGEVSEDVEVLLGINSSIMEAASVNIPGFTVGFHRGGYPTQNPPIKSAIFDDISLSYNAQACKLSEKQRLQIISSISKSLGPFDPNKTIPGVLNDDQKGLLAIHNATLERLEGLNEELIRGSEKFRRNLESDFHSRSHDLEKDFRSRSEALDAEFEEKKRSFYEREESLERRLKEIDDRQNTHVRREIRKDILDEIKNRTEEFKLTAGTNRLRVPIHAVCLALITGLAIANLFYMNELTSAIHLENVSKSAMAVMAVKQLVLSAAFGATAVFYIRWLNAWSSEHAAAEFKLRQFQLDIERASWVVETALEWKDSKGMAIPNELLEPITRNLFSSSPEQAKELHPADELASALIGSASMIRLKAGDSEVELDGKRLRKKG